jgi:hypothetical protein
VFGIVHDKGSYHVSRFAHLGQPAGCLELGWRVRAREERLRGVGECGESAQHEKERSFLIAGP